MRLSRLFAVLMFFVTNEAHGWHLISHGAHVDLNTQKVALLVGGVSPNMATSFVTQMLNTMGIPGDRLVIINSNGGDLASGQVIIDAMKAEQKTGVRMVCYVANTAASMAFDILTHCDKRIANAKGNLMFHAAGFEKLEETTDRRLTAKELRRLADELDEDDRNYAVANRKALKMSRKDYEMYSDRNHTWRPFVLMIRGYLHGLGVLSP